MVEGDARGGKRGEVARKMPESCDGRCHAAVFRGGCALCVVEVGVGWGRGGGGVRGGSLVTGLGRG